jgi:uncharacterized protein YycO
MLNLKTIIRGGFKMKKKSLLAKLICTCVVTSLFIVPTSAGASTNDIKTKAEQQQGVYSQAYTDAEWAKAKKQPVMQDKVTSKTSTNGIASAAAWGSYPTRNGVILVTPDYYKDLIPTGHAGIIWDGATGRIIESLAGGVTIGDNDWNITRNVAYGVSVDGTTIAEDNDASNWCRDQVGIRYNYIYTNPYTRSAFYCSQLVYASYLDNCFVNLDTFAYLQAVHPMELVNSSNTYKIYEK